MSASVKIKDVYKGLSVSFMNRYRDILYKASCVYDVDYYAIAQITGNQMNLIHSYSDEWVNLYLEKEYYKYDHALASPLLPNIWNDSYIDAAPKRTKTLIKDALDHNITAGHTIPIMINKQLSYLTFSCGGSSVKKTNFLNRYKYLHQAFANTLSIINSLDKSVDQQNLALIDSLIEEQKNDILQSRKKKMTGRNALISASDACKTLPADLRVDIKMLLDIAQAVIEE